MSLLTEVPKSQAMTQLCGGAIESVAQSACPIVRATKEVAVRIGTPLLRLRVASSRLRTLHVKGVPIRYLDVRSGMKCVIKLYLSSKRYLRNRTGKPERIK